MQTRSKYKALSHPVLLNELMLENVFKFFELKYYLPLRLVCRKWNAAILKEISKDKKAVFSDDPNQRMINNEPESVHYFKVLKIAKLEFEAVEIVERCCKRSYNEKAKQLDKIYFDALKTCGSQVKELEFSFAMATEADLVLVKTVLSLTPNAEVLNISCGDEMTNFFNVFKDFCHPKVRLLFMPDFWAEFNEEEFVGTMLKCFPNLESNFGNDELDCELLKMIVDKKVSMKLRQFKNDDSVRYCNFLSQLSPRVHALTRLHLWNGYDFGHNKAQIIYNILQNFASTLTIVKISYFNVDMEEVAEILLPPLPLLRKLEVVSENYQLNKLFLTSNMGKRIAKDYPVLEYFTFKPVAYLTGEKPEESKGFWTSCKLWSSVVPIENEGVKADFDLSPLKFLKFVDLNIPPEWTEDEGNREWCKKFVDVYLKLYGNACKDNAQNLIDFVM